MLRVLSKNASKFALSRSFSAVPAAKKINWAAFDLSQSSEDEKADFAKLKSKWESLEETVDAELKSPVPEINWADWSKKLKDSNGVVGAWKKVIESAKYNPDAKVNATVGAEHARVHAQLMKYMETSATEASARLEQLKKQRESLLWEKYNVDSLTFDVMMARYPVLAEEIYAEVEAHEWFVDTGVVDMPKGWGVLVLDEAGNPTPKPKEEDHHHHH